jgi:hypothetical protein
MMGLSRFSKQAAKSTREETRPFLRSRRRNLRGGNVDMSRYRRRASWCAHNGARNQIFVFCLPDGFTRFSVTFGL